MALDPGYSLVAIEQLDAVRSSGDLDVHSDLVVVCEAILDDPGFARAHSSAVTTDRGVDFRFAAPGHAPVRVFWSTTGPTIEAVFPYPS